nr:glycosyltransferase family 2 protein [Deltaproteobacteria bacterium]
MSFDVIIVNYNCYEALNSCLSGLEKWEPAKINAIYVVDNSQRPRPNDMVRRFPGVTWLANSKNVGFASAVNRALAKATAPYVCLLNPDAVIAGPLWGPLEEWLKKNTYVGILGPKILDADGSIQGSARAFPSLATVFFGRTSLISRLWPDNPFTRKNILSSPSLGEPISVDWVSGACMIVKRSAIEDVGTMDPRFFLYWEDCDWCTRFRFAGWKVIYHPGVGPVIHHVGQASKNARWLALYHFHRSAVLLYWKYDRTPARIGSLIALAGATLRFAALGLKLALS